MPATLAQRLARLCVHGDGHVGMDNFRFLRERRVLAEHLLDLPLVADQQKAHLGMPDKRKRGAADHDGRAVISAHGVERYRDWNSHMTCRGSRRSADLSRKAAKVPLGRACEDNQLGRGDNPILRGKKAAQASFFSRSSTANGLFFSG